MPDDRRRPTVEIRVQVPRCRPGHGWAWATWQEHPTVAEEPVYDGAELQSVMYTWAHAVAGLMGKNGPATFRLTGYGMYTRRTVAVYSWRWDSELRRYRAEGEPWCVWDARSAQAAAELRREQKTRR